MRNWKKMKSVRKKRKHRGEEDNENKGQLAVTFQRGSKRKKIY